MLGALLTSLKSNETGSRGCFLYIKASVIDALPNSWKNEYREATSGGLSKCKSSYL